MRISDWSSDVCSSDLQFALVAISSIKAGAVDAGGIDQILHRGRFEPMRPEGLHGARQHLVNIESLFPRHAWAYRMSGTIGKDILLPMDTGGVVRPLPVQAIVLYRILLLADELIRQHTPLHAGVFAVGLLRIAGQADH